MAASTLSTTSSFNFTNHKKSLSSLQRSKFKPIIVSALPTPYSDASKTGLSSNLETTPDEMNLYSPIISSISPIVARRGAPPPIMPAVMTPGGPLDLSTLVTLATIDENADILIYVNCPGGSTYSVLAIYDCMSWIKPKVGTVCFGVAASEGALLLAGGEKGMRYAMPNARIMIHQPQSGCGGHVEDVRRQVNEAFNLAIKST
nr:ATP-dependent Clp protease proteolytic subunit 6, chloroplastic [Tanacetum cinerariifolium]